MVFISFSLPSSIPPHSIQWSNEMVERHFEGQPPFEELTAKALVATVLVIVGGGGGHLMVGFATVIPVSATGS